ncbi:MAG: TIR domain-containing protein [Actinomycetota bacterium]
MKKSKQYEYTRFSADVPREAIEVFRAKTNRGEPAWSVKMSVDVGDSEWEHDSSEEFFADYRKAHGKAFYRENNGDATVELFIYASKDAASVAVAAPDRASIEAVFEILERHAASSRLPVPKKKPPDPPTIFIGHGGSPKWRDLKDHLHEKHGYRVEAYEIGARAGHTIRDVLNDMLSKSSFAILVITGEDQMSDGAMRARQNVVHEAGLFQGRLGFTRAIVLLEKGAEEFSNIHGIDQIRFDKGRIKETFGDVVATIRREFPEGAA